MENFDCEKIILLTECKQLMKLKSIWTIGHSTKSIGEFIAMLQSFQIELVVDIRRFPGSKRYPHFNKDALQASLAENKIKYTHIEKLGGRRKPVDNSHNNAWRVAAFRGYADYMETDDFQRSVDELELLASKIKVAFMCSEAVWWSCHRSVVSDYLKFKGWLVVHIMSVNKSEEHPYTKPARIEDNKLVYTLSQ
jgi:uncharacterized protein (DUF488 family)